MTVATIAQNGGGGELVRPGGASHALAHRPSLDEQWRFAQALSDAGLLPEAYRKNPPNVLLAMQKAEQHGIHLMTALEGFSPIKGKLFMEATTMRALIQGAGHRFDVLEQTRERCVIESQRRGEATIFRDEYDLEDARIGGLLTNENYRKHPKRMLLARCTSQAGNAHFADVLKGTAYTPEDFGLTGDQLSETSVAASVSPAPAAAALMASTAVPSGDTADIAALVCEAIAKATTPLQLNAVAGTITEAERADAIDAETARELRDVMYARAGALPAGQKALTKMHAALGELGLTANRDEKLKAVSNVIGHPVESTSELTGAEADLVWRRASEAVQDGGRMALLHPTEPPADVVDPDDFADERTPEEIAATS